MVAGIDDEANMRIMRLFNEEAGTTFLKKTTSIDEEIIGKLHLLGISSIANLMGCIKMAKYYELNEDDILFTVATDSMEMYQSRIIEERAKFGDYTDRTAEVDFEAQLLGIKTDHILELNYYDKKRIHNLKYFTWIEQQGKTVEELNAQWYDDNYWTNEWKKHELWDEKIKEFNERTGVISEYK